MSKKEKFQLHKDKIFHDFSQERIRKYSFLKFVQGTAIKRKTQSNMQGGPIKCWGG